MALTRLASIPPKNPKSPKPMPPQVPQTRSIALLTHPPINIFGVNYTGDGFQIGDQMIPTPIALRRAIKDQLHSGMRFDFGIPATAICIETALPHVRGTVTHIEPDIETSPNSTTLQVSVPSTGGTVTLTVTIANSSAQLPPIDSIVPLAFDLKQMLLFDGSGDRIYPPIALTLE